MTELSAEQADMAASQLCRRLNSASSSEVALEKSAQRHDKSLSMSTFVFIASIPPCLGCRSQHLDASQTTAETLKGHEDKRTNARKPKCKQRRNHTNITISVGHEIEKKGIALLRKGCGCDQMTCCMMAIGCTGTR